MLKKLISVILAISMICSLLTFLPLIASAEEYITRSEYVARVVDTFNMVVEDTNMPDNYFSDLTENMEFYRDILVAVEFGIIDLEAGEAFRPNDILTRQEAAQILNYALSFQLDENTEYTFLEKDSVLYPDDIQVSINRGWFVLANGSFLPNKSVTLSEADAMLSDAEYILENEAIDDNYINSFVFRDGVIDLGVQTKAVLDENNTAYIENLTVQILPGDVFVIYQCPSLPIPLKAVDISTDGTKTIITTTRDNDTASAIVSADSQGSADIDLEDFVFEENTSYQITHSETGEVEEFSMQLMSISYDKKSDTITASHSIKLGNSTEGSISVDIIDPKLKTKSKNNTYEAYIVADTSLTTSLSFDLREYMGIPQYINLGAVNIYGIGTIYLSMQYSIDGGLSLSCDGKVKAGVSYSKNDGIRLIKSYEKTGFTFSAEANIKVGLRLTAKISIWILEGSVWGEIGAKAYFKLKNYSTDSPSTCITLGSYLYVEVGVSAKCILIDKSCEKSYEVINEDNSPVRVVNHYEDGKLVTYCSRGDSLKYQTPYTSRYFNPSQSYAQSSYGTAAQPIVIWEYTVIEDNNAHITAYKGTASAVSIPKMLDGYTITGIANKALYGNEILRSVTIPNTVTYIGHNAFACCKNLRTVNLPSSLTEIGDYAFNQCSSLTEIALPTSLTKIGWYSFADCTSLLSAFIPKDLEIIRAFMGCSSLTNVTFEEGITKIPAYSFVNTGIEEIEIPPTVTAIGSGAFQLCKNLRTVNLPSSLTEIGDYAFTGCSSLTEIILPASLTNIGQYSFSDCTSLSSAFIPKNVTGNSPFANCSALTTVTFEEGITHIPSTLFKYSGIAEIEIPSTVTAIESGAFEYCKNLRTVNLPSSLTEIGNYAFTGCSSLNEVTLPTSLTNIGQYSFSDCTSLSSVFIPKNVTGNSPFTNCSALTTVTFEEGITLIPSTLFKYSGITEIEIPSTVTAIEYQAFAQCENLRKVTLPDSVITIEHRVFEGCTSLNDIKLPEKLTTISDGLFAGCSSLSEIEFSLSVTSIGNSVFQNCSSLTKAVLPDGISKIPYAAFENCTLLTECVLPESITHIDSYAFKNCQSLKDVSIPQSTVNISAEAFSNTGITTITIPESVTYLNSKVFSNCDALTEAYINSSCEIYSEAFYDCDSLQKVVIGDFVTAIGYKAFFSCDKLSEITIGKYVKTIGENALSSCPALTSLTLPMYCETIENSAATENTALKHIYISPYTSNIDNSAFSYTNQITIHGASGSFAEEFASNLGINFIPEEILVTELKYPQSEMKFKARKEYIIPLEVNPSYTTEVIEYISDDENIVYISPEGKLETRDYGTTTIYAFTADAYTELTVTVVNPIYSIIFDRENLLVSAGKTLNLSYTLEPSDHTDDLIFKSSDEKIATVDENGVVTALSEGETTITAASKYADYDDIFAQCKITVLPFGSEVVETTALTLDYTEKELSKGGSPFTLTATVYPENATNKTVIWSSSDSYVATVKDGVVTPLDYGKTIITATTYDGAYSCECVIYVTDKPEITALTCRTMGTKLAVTVNAVNVPDYVTARIAAYDPNGHITEIKKLTFTNGTAKATINKGDVIMIKSFIWDSYDSMLPLCDAYTHTITAD